MSDLIGSWIGLESVSGRPTYARYIADLGPTNHLPSVAELRPTHPRTLPDKTDTTPIYDRQTTDNLSRRDLSNMFERSLPDKFVCLNINRHQTDKTKSIPTVNRSLPEFDDFCRFEVGFVSVWSVWLGYYLLNYGKHDGTTCFVDMLHAHSCVSLISRPTRVSKSSATLIDNIFTNSYSDIENTFQCLIYTDITDHYPIVHIDFNIQVCDPDTVVTWEKFLSKKQAAILLICCFTRLSICKIRNWCSKGLQFISLFVDKTLS